MQYVCDAPGAKTWFRIETEGEAMLEAAAMRHSLDHRFRHERETAIGSYRPPRLLSPIERDIGLAAHIGRTMPIFLTLRDRDGTALATAVLPQRGDTAREPRVVGPGYDDAFSSQQDAIAALATHFGMTLRRESYNRPETGGR
ncbi:MAG TPA: hypothetical protein VGB91_10610 [Rhizomicrobium sp.]